MSAARQNWSVIFIAFFLSPVAHAASVCPGGFGDDAGATLVQTSRAARLARAGRGAAVAISRLLSPAIAAAPAVELTQAIQGGTFRLPFRTVTKEGTSGAAAANSTPRHWRTDYRLAIVAPSLEALGFSRAASPFSDVPEVEEFYRRALPVGRDWLDLTVSVYYGIRNSFGSPVYLDGDREPRFAGFDSVWTELSPVAVDLKFSSRSGDLSTAAIEGRARLALAMTPQAPDSLPSGAASMRLSFDSQGNWILFIRNIIHAARLSDAQFERVRAATAH